MNVKPYAKLIDILRAALQQVEKDTAVDSADGAFDDVKDSLKRTIDALEPRTDMKERDDSAPQTR